jgi:hypothetical protein
MAGVDLVANATDDGGGPVALTVSVACNEAPAAGESSRTRRSSPWTMPPGPRTCTCAPSARARARGAPTRSP